VRASAPARRAAALAAAVLGLGLAGCGPAGPVAELGPTPSALRLDYGRFEPLGLRWKPLAELPPGSEPIVFVHLLAPDGSVARTFDHAFPGEWRVGGEVTDELVLSQSLLATPLPAGSYRLTVGLYDPAGGRWPLRVAAADAEEVDDAEYALATVEVPREIETAVRVRFSSDWQPAESGSDLQVLARRWLGRAGTLRFEELPGPARVRLELRVPGPAELAAPLELDEGAGGPIVVLASSCGGAETSVSGPGRHVVDLELAAEPGAVCDVGLRPNFRVLLPGGEARSLVLESLAWAPGGSV
jgi:hypothetical protein